MRISHRSSRAGTHLLTDILGTTLVTMPQGYLNVLGTCWQCDRRAIPFTELYRHRLAPARFTMVSRQHEKNGPSLVYHCSRQQYCRNAAMRSAMVGRLFRALQIARLI
jgi:hypothetical protein